MQPSSMKKFLLLTFLFGAGLLHAAEVPSGCSTLPQTDDQGWTGWLSQVETHAATERRRAEVRRGFQARLDALRVEHRALLMLRDGRGTEDLQDPDGEFSKKFYENLLAQARLNLEMNHALADEPVSGTDLVQSFLR